jgi:2-polyprenyl-6-methoxyphenol hydroxylase-like FAD-dependent oxidoreductase
MPYRGASDTRFFPPTLLNVLAEHLSKPSPCGVFAFSNGQPQKKSIGIFGGGIGGVATAVALHQIGFDVSIYVREERLCEAGAGMMLWPNATRVLRGLGVLEKVLSRSGRNTHFLVRTSSGRTLMTIALGKFDVPAVCMRRADHLSILLSALPEDRLHLGCELRRLREQNDKVLVFLNRDRVAEHDAVIGADGIRSKVRTELFGFSDPIYRGYTIRPKALAS